MFLKNYDYAPLINYFIIFFIVVDCIQAKNESISLRNKLQGKIFFGIDSTIEEYPSVISLFVYDTGISQFICGGSILTKWIVLTAAHCVYLYQDPTLYSIKTGSSFRTEITPGGKLYNVKKIIMNRQFKFMTYNKDVALLQTSQEIKFTKLVQSVQLIQNTVPDDAAMDVVGWGQTETGDLAEQLKKAVIYKMNTEECKKALPQQSITKYMFCAKDRDKKYESDTCTGDSGGPIFYNKKLAGLTSWGRSKCTVGETEPGVYVDILRVSDWIHKHIIYLTEGDRKRKSNAILL